MVGTLLGLCNHMLHVQLNSWSEIHIGGKWWNSSSSYAAPSAPSSSELNPSSWWFTCCQNSWVRSLTERHVLVSADPWKMILLLIFRLKIQLGRLFKEVLQVGMKCHTGSVIGNAWSVPLTGTNPTRNEAMSFRVIALRTAAPGHMPRPVLLRHVDGLREGAFLIRVPRRLIPRFAWVRRFTRSAHWPRRSLISWRRRSLRARLLSGSAS